MSFFNGFFSLFCSADINIRLAFEQLHKAYAESTHCHPLSRQSWPGHRAWRTKTGRSRRSQVVGKSCALAWAALCRRSHFHVLSQLLWCDSVQEGKKHRERQEENYGRTHDKQKDFTQQIWFHQLVSSHRSPLLNLCFNCSAKHELSTTASLTRGGNDDPVLPSFLRFRELNSCLKLWAKMGRNPSWIF